MKMLNIEQFMKLIDIRQKNKSKLFRERINHKHGHIFWNQIMTSKNQKDLSEERIREITERIKNNFYEKDEVLSTVAERILRSPHFREILERKKEDEEM